MTLRMSKVVGEISERVMQNAAWGAVSRIGVPIILALVLTGIPAHLMWASSVNTAIALAKQDITRVSEDLRVLKDTAREDDKTTVKLLTDVAAVKQDVAAVLRAVTRLEGNEDRRRAPLP